LRNPGEPTRSRLAGEGKVVVAGHVVPLPALVPDHHHAVLLGVEVVIRLVGPPVLKVLKGGTKTITSVVERDQSDVDKVVERPDSPEDRRLSSGTRSARPCR